MSRDMVNRICAALPGAEVSDPWGGGHDAWKLGGKIFAIIGTTDAGGAGVSVKTPDIETAAMLIDARVGTRAPYLHRSWIRMPVDTDAAELRHRIGVSYDLIRASLPRRIRENLPQRRD